MTFAVEKVRSVAFNWFSNELYSSLAEGPYFFCRMCVRPADAEGYAG